MAKHCKCKSVNIYTDGACSGNQRAENLGGWGAILEYGRHKKELFGGERDTTNNRMEMTALLSALLALKEGGLSISVFSDSAYLMDCFRRRWYANWKANGWMTSKNTPVENRDLWERLLTFLDAHTFRFYRVKGHVRLSSSDSALDALYGKFVEWNGAGFSRDDFLYVTEMNNRADELANMGIASLKENS